MSKGVRGTAFAVVIFGALSACTAQTVVDPTSASSVVPSTSSGAKLTETPTSTTPITPSTSSSGITSAATESTVESTVASVADPWPADFTPEQASMAQSALTAWAGYSNILNAAQQNPTAKDWTADVRTYTADPAAEQFLTSLASLVTAEVHAEGDVINENPQVTMINGNRVIIISCVDSTNRRAVDTSGTQVMEPDPNPRVLSTAAVTDYGADNGGWLVREVNQVSPVTPC